MQANCLKLNSVKSETLICPESLNKSHHTFSLFIDDPSVPASTHICNLQCHLWSNPRLWTSSTSQKKPVHLKNTALLLFSGRNTHPRLHHLWTGCNSIMYGTSTKKSSANYNTSRTQPLVSSPAPEPTGPPSFRTATSILSLHVSFSLSFFQYSALLCMLVQSHPFVEWYVMQHIV